MPKTYSTYDYDDNAPFKERTVVIEEYIDKKLKGINTSCSCDNMNTDKIEDTVKDAVKDSLEDINCKFCAIHNHIDKAKDEIIENENAKCDCNLATKEDIENVVSKINGHTDDKFNEIDFMKQFSDLNEQMSKITNK